mmetsp:Transcript_60630/g.170856  ORF Transcript_60630/g.170856 Transcript_60630/m.170856 type:complete len:216 (+) Transcript_60630:106-753(+)
MLLVLRPGIALAERPVDAELQRLLQVLLFRRDDPHRAHADGDVVEEGLRQALLHRLHVGLEHVRADQPHAAVDVEAHAAGRDDRLRVPHVERRDVADREAVAAVDVRQPDGVLLNPRQRRDVADLLDGGEEAADVRRLSGEASQLVEHEPLQLGVHIEPPRHVHVLHEPRLDGVHRVRLPLDVLHFLIETPFRPHRGACDCSTSSASYGAAAKRA